MTMGTGVDNVTLPYQVCHLLVKEFKLKCLYTRYAVHPAIGVTIQSAIAMVQADLMTVRAGQRYLTATMYGGRWTWAGLLL